MVLHPAQSWCVDLAGARLVGVFSVVFFLSFGWVGSYMLDPLPGAVLFGEFPLPGVAEAKFLVFIFLFCLPSEVMLFVSGVTATWNHYRWAENWRTSVPWGRDCLSCCCQCTLASLLSRLLEKVILEIAGMKEGMISAAVEKWSFKDLCKGAENDASPKVTYWFRLCCDAWGGTWKSKYKSRGRKTYAFEIKT